MLTLSQLSSVRDELSSGEGDKWRQRRNNSFDQNRQLEEVTRERWVSLRIRLDTDILHVI